MRSDQNFIKDVKKIAGTQDYDSLETGAQEATLLKLNISNIDSNGWYIRIDALAEEKWAYSSFEWAEGSIPNGVKTNNIINFTDTIKVLVIQDNNKSDWVIIKYLQDITDYDIEPGTKILKIGDSSIKITSERIDINTPELYVNGEKIS